MPPYNPKEYKTVAERIKEAHDSELIEEVISDQPVMINDVLGYIKATVKFKDGMIASGIGSFRLDAKKGAQLTNPLEDAETSAVGRALAFLGIGVTKSIASAEEMAIAHDRETDLDISTMQRMIGRLRLLLKQAQEDGLKIDHRLAPLKPNEMSYDEIVEYGTYLRELLNIK